MTILAAVRYCACQLRGARQTQAERAWYARCVRRYENTTRNVRRSATKLLACSYVKSLACRRGGPQPVRSGHRTVVVVLYMGCGLLQLMGNFRHRKQLGTKPFKP